MRVGSGGGGGGGGGGEEEKEEEEEVLLTAYNKWRDVDMLTMTQCACAVCKPSAFLVCVLMCPYTCPHMYPHVQCAHSSRIFVTTERERERERERFTT